MFVSEVTKPDVMKTYHLTPLVCTLLFFLVANAQTAGELNNSTELSSFSCDATTSSFKIQGTSSLHDWEMTSQACKGTLSIRPGEKSLDFAEITVEVSVNSLKSGKRAMDRKCYDALKSKNHPNILFVLDRVKDLSPKGSSNYEAVFQGNLHIAGVRRPTDIAVRISQKQGKIQIEGSKSLKMSDFEVEPPTALMGTIKTGNDIDIIFNLNFNQL